jgi:GT2 family glycosyltransferase/SAM-dependent methyltransferase
MKKAVIIIPNWNGKNLLKTCLNSLRFQTSRDFEIVVVDNGSEDGSCEYIKKYFPEVILIKFDKNYGFAKAINVGIEKTSEKYLILINNDTKVNKNCVKYLIEAAEKHKEVGFVAAKMLNFYKKNIIDSAGDYIDVAGHANNIGLGEEDGEKFNKEGYMFLATGGGSLFRRELFEKVGFFDEDYFASFEDVDLCLRGQFAGFKGWYEPRAMIYHIHKATAARIKSQLEYLQFRNMTITIIKNFPTALFMRNFNWLRIILVHLNTIRYLSAKGFFLQAIMADSWVLLHLPKILQKRFKIQRNRIASDEYMISNFREKKLTPLSFLGKAKHRLYSKFSSPGEDYHRRQIEDWLKNNQDKISGVIWDVGAGLMTRDWIKQLGDYKTLNDTKYGNPDLVADLEDLRKFPSESVDTIICTEVLEHTPHPDEAVAEMRRILKKSGWIFLSSPFWWVFHGLDDYKDYWRFTHQAWEYLTRDYSYKKITKCALKKKSVNYFYKLIKEEVMFIPARGGEATTGYLCLAQK